MDDTGLFGKIYNPDVLTCLANLSKFDEIDPLSQISETDPRQWQMEWMDNYMDALEELEDSTTRK